MCINQVHIIMYFVMHELGATYLQWQLAMTQGSDCVHFLAFESGRATSASL